jgi:hypothetical protein
VATNLNRAERFSRLARTVVLVVASGWFIPALASTTGEDSKPKAAAHQAPHHRSRPGLEDRVRTLSHALDLDARQQSELRKALVSQREEVRRIWGDASMPAANRISATRAISDKTEDRIRALLNDEQKNKYNPPRQPREAAADSAEPTVEDWMNAGKPKSTR